MKEIIAELEQVTAKGYNAHQVFCDWLDLMLYSFLGDKEFYLTVVKRYRNVGEVGNREIDHFKNALHLLMDKMRLDNDELLGEIYMTMDLSFSKGGQFFTPKHIASFMTQMLSPIGMKAISDPCCGAGIMLVETCKLMTYEALNHTLFIAQDINHTCVKMCALNMLFFNLDAYIILGNTLAFECTKVYQTHRTALGGSIRVLDAQETEDMRIRLCKQITPQNNLQTTLFNL